MALNVNTDALIKFTLTLDKISRSALPVAVRTALNSAAYDVKQNSMPHAATEEFVNRTKTFFRYNSKVDQASGFSINTMKSAVGFVEGRLNDEGTNFSVKDLEQQEHAGTIKSKTFIPTIFARSGTSNRGLVKPNLRLKKIRDKIIESKNFTGKTEKERFQIASQKAGVNGFVLHKNILWQINSLREKKAIKRTPIYSVKVGRVIKVRATNFMKIASLKSNQKLESFYIAEAKKQIEKLTK